MSSIFMPDYNIPVEFEWIASNVDFHVEIVKST